MADSYGALPPRYEFRGPLGAGGMGEVLRVFDRERAAEVALKLHRPAPGGSAADLAEAAFLFEQEFWALSRLRHPVLVEAFDAGRLDDGRPYFTMELVDGADLAVDGPVSAASVRGWLPSVLGALGHLHGQGWRHGDLKPGNLRIRPDGTAKLMDLGLLARVGRAGGAIRGTLAYVAPEVVGNGAADGRADLYALGAVLHHALAGQPPFAATETLALLRAHLQVAPGALPPDVPADLAAVVRRLLAKAPGERYGLAADVALALGLAAGDTQAGLLGAALIGREPARRALLVALGQAGTTWVVGPAGSGKSRLLDETRATARLGGALAFAAAGLGPDAPPYAALRAWLPALASLAPAAAERLRPVLSRVAPELGGELAQALDGQAERLRLHAAVAELASAAAPGAAAWFVDDADQLDAASRALLDHLRGGAERPWAFVLAAAAGDEALVLEPLAAADVAALAQALLGQDHVPAPVIEALDALSGGLPGHLEALLAHWLRTGALRRAAGRWDLAAGAELALPSGLAGLQDATLAALGPDPVQLAGAAGLLGAAGELAWLAAACGLAPEPFRAALDALEIANVLAREDAAYRLRRPAEATRLAAGLTEPERAAVHGRAAAWAAGRGGAPETAPLPLALAAAHHHLRGPEPLAGVSWAIAAAQGALAVFAAASAEPLLARARALGGLAAADRLALDLLSAESLRWLGRPDEAITVFESGLLASLPADAAGARARTTYAVLLQQKGRYVDAGPAFKVAADAARAAGDVAGEARATFFGSRVAYFAGDAAGARGLAGRSLGLARAASPPDVLAAILSFAGFLAATTEPLDPAGGEALLGEAVALAGTAGNPYNLYEALNNRGNLLLHAGRPTEAGADFAACVDLCRRMGSPGERVFAHLNLGVAHLACGALAEARRELEGALALAVGQGRKYPEGFSLGYLGLAKARGGAYAEALADLDRAAALAGAIANQAMVAGIASCRAEAMLHLGRLAEARAALALARETEAASGSHEQAGRLRWLEAAIAVAAADPSADTLVQALLAGASDAEAVHAQVLAADHYRRRGDLPAALAHATTALALADACGLTQAAAQAAYILAAPDACARAAATGDPLLTALAAHALEPQGGATRRAARRNLRDAMTGLTEAEREAFLADPARAAALAPDAAGDGIGRDRLFEIAELAVRAAAQPDLDAVLTESVAALVALADADRGFLLLYEDMLLSHKVFVGMGADTPDGHSSALAHQVLGSGRPVFVEDAQADAALATQQSVQALALRSVVGVPLIARDAAGRPELIGVMIADSRRVNTGFGPADLDVAEALGLHVAGIIASARRLDAARANAERQTLVNEAARAALSAPDRDAARQVIAKAAINAVGAERALWLAGPNLACRAGWDATGSRQPPDQAFSASIANWAQAAQEPVALIDHDEPPAGFTPGQSVLALGLRSVCAAPLGALGVLYLDSRRVVEPAPGALALLAELASLFAAIPE